MNQIFRTLILYWLKRLKTNHNDNNINNNNNNEMNSYFINGNLFYICFIRIRGFFTNCICLHAIPKNEKYTFERINKQLKQV